MGQVEVEFIDKVQGIEVTDFSVDLGKIHEVIENSLILNPETGRIRSRVRWQDLNLGLGEMWRIREFTVKMEMLRLKTILPYGAARLSGKLPNQLTPQGEIQFNFAKSLIMKS